MMTFTIEFNYTGKAPTESFMTGIMADTDYAEIKRVSVTRWTITTGDSKSNVEKNLSTTIKNKGKYANGQLTSVDVS